MACVVLRSSLETRPRGRESALTSPRPNLEARVDLVSLTANSYFTGAKSKCSQCLCMFQ